MVMDEAYQRPEKLRTGIEHQVEHFMKQHVNQACSRTLLSSHCSEDESHIVQ